MGKNIQIDSEFSGKPFQFTKLQMLLNALEAFLREPLCAGGDYARQATEAGPRLPPEEANAVGKQQEEGGGHLLTRIPAMPHMTKDLHL